ncbi:hypothetical protein [uncultured Lactobacillus sp.]|nr:hypothetical protein [uncultured Lactobacillus sp.]
MKIQIAEDQLSMKNMEIDLSELDKSLMPALSDSAEILMNAYPTVDKPY